MFTTTCSIGVCIRVLSFLGIVYMTVLCFLLAHLRVQGTVRACVLEVYACVYEVRSFFSLCEAASSGLLASQFSCRFFVQHNSFSKLTRICHCGEVARAVCSGGRCF